MTPLTPTIQMMTQKYKFDIMPFVEQHPQLFFFIWFLILPILMLLVLVAGTAIVMFPIACICGWL